MTRLFFSNTASQTSLSASVVAADIVLPFGIPLTGWPGSVPYKAVIEPDTANAEVVKVTAASVGSFTVVRGQDGTTAVNHAAGSIIEHRWSAAEADEANLHVNSNSGVHGIAGNVVGTTDAQTLTNKTLTSPTSDTATMRASSTTPAIAAKAASSGSANIQEWQDSSGVRLSRVGQHGEVEIKTSDPAVIPLHVEGATSQSADLIEVDDGAAVKRLAVSPQGALVLWPNAYPGLKIIPKDASQNDLVLFRNSTDTANKARIDSFGNIEGAAFVADGSGVADAFQFPSGGAKFKVDSNGNIVTAGSLTADTVVADDVITRVGHNINSTPFSAASGGAIEGIGHSHGYPVVNGRRYRFTANFQTSATSSGTLREVTARFSTGTVSNASSPIFVRQIPCDGFGALRDDRQFTGEFVAPATATLNIALGVRTAGGAGQTNVDASEVFLDCVGV